MFPVYRHRPMTLDQLKQWANDVTKWPIEQCFWAMRAIDQASVFVQRRD